MKIRAGREKLPTKVFIPFASTSVMMLNLETAMDNFTIDMK